MLLDLIFIGLIALNVWIGYRRGFVVSIIKTFGWIISIWLAAKWSTGLSVYVRLFMNTSNTFTERAIGFVGGLIIIKLAYFAITLLFSKSHHEGDIIGMTDAVAGAAFGLISGIILVFVTVLAIPAVADLFNLTTLSDMFNSSRGATFLLEKNPLIGIVDHISGIEELKEVDMDALQEFAKKNLERFKPLIQKILNR